MNKYFVSVIDGNAVFTDGKDFFIDTVLSEADAVPGMFTESEEAMLKINASKLLDTARKIAAANSRLKRFAFVSCDSELNYAVVAGIGDGTPEGEEYNGDWIKLENPDLKAVSDNFFENRKGDTL